MSHIERLLSAIEQGDPQASEKLLPLVYDELRLLAAQKMAQENPGQTLQATALVHEAYVRLVDGDQVERWNSRGHFFAAAAEAMRRILVDQARRRNAAKRGGAAGRVEFHESAIAAPASGDQLLAINEVLDQLSTADPEAASLVKLRYFVGLNMNEAAAALGISVRKAHEIWAYARSWLHKRMRED
jgi:RNA polymerase sigma factor (TIGR02999 family)